MPRGGTADKRAELRARLEWDSHRMKNNLQLWTYLNNLGDEPGAGTGGGDCVICCQPKRNQVGMLPCGHSYW